MKSLKERFSESEQPGLPVDYFLVATSDEAWYVSREMAQGLEAALGETPTPRWVTFVDLTGARVRLRARLIWYVEQSTAEQRAKGRALYRARQAEKKAESGWDD
jgi:hypothetical protein